MFLITVGIKRTSGFSEDYHGKEVHNIKARGPSFCFSFFLFVELFVFLLNGKSAILIDSLIYFLFTKFIGFFVMLWNKELD